MLQLQFLAPVEGLVSGKEAGDQCHLSPVDWGGCQTEEEVPHEADSFLRVELHPGGESKRGRIAAAQYSEAAYKLGQQKPLLVMDALYKAQAQWARDGKIERIVAKALSPKDMQNLKAILKDPSIRVSIDKGIELGTKRKVLSTPTMFIYYIGGEQRAEGLVT